MLETELGHRPGIMTDTKFDYKVKSKKPLPPGDYVCRLDGVIVTENLLTVEVTVTSKE